MEEGEGWLNNRDNPTKSLLTGHFCSSFLFELTISYVASWGFNIFIVFFFPLFFSCPLFFPSFSLFRSFFSFLPFPSFFCSLFILSSLFFPSFFSFAFMSMVCINKEGEREKGQFSLFVQSSTLSSPSSSSSSSSLSALIWLKLSIHVGPERFFFSWQSATSFADFIAVLSA